MRNIPYFPSMHARMRSDERISPRYLLTLDCSIASSQIGRRPARLKDLSLQGCRLETPFTFARDAVIVVTIDQLSPRGGIVCWCSPSEVGLTFAEPLHQSVIDHLLELNWAGSAGRC